MKTTISGSLALALVVLTATGGRAASTDRPEDPFWLLRPTVRVSSAERQKIHDGDVLVRALPAQDHELAILAIGSLNTSAGDLIARVRNIVELKKSRFVPQIGRFSNPPALHDLSALTLDDVDLEGIGKCRPGDCELKLGAEEIVTLHQVIAGAGEDWKSAVTEDFRRLVLDRVKAYLTLGHRGLPEYRDRQKPVDLASTFSRLLQRSDYLRRLAPELAAYLRGYPAVPLPGVESFLYWSKETFGQKPVISVTHMNIVRGDGRHGFPEVLIVSKQVFATHYMNGALALTMLLPGQDRPSARYLVYVNRSWLDVLGGFPPGIRRATIERRVKGETERIFAIQLDRLEQGRQGNAVGR